MTIKLSHKKETHLGNYAQAMKSFACTSVLMIYEFKIRIFFFQTN